MLQQIRIENKSREINKNHRLNLIYTGKQRSIFSVQIKFLRSEGLRYYYNEQV